MENAKKSVGKYFWPYIDIAKVYCALLVVMIHCLEVPEGHPIAKGIVQCMSSQAVPFFMIVSGFFFGNRMKNTCDVVENAGKCIKQWLMLYFAWTVLWLPYFINIYQGKYSSESALFILLIMIRRVFLAGQGVYWYLLVLAEATAVLTFFIKIDKIKLLYFISGVGLIFGLLFEANISAWGLNEIVYKIFSWSNNFIMKGIPYVAIGYYMSNHAENLRIKKRWIVLVYFLVSSFMIALYMWNQNRWLIFYPIQSVCLFMFTIQHFRVNINKASAVLCRNISTAIYFLHTIIIYGVVDIVWGVNAPIILKFAVSVLGSIGGYLSVQKLQIRPLKWLLCVK